MNNDFDFIDKILRGEPENYVSQDGLDPDQTVTSGDSPVQTQPVAPPVPQIPVAQIDPILPIVPQPLVAPIAPPPPIVPPTRSAQNIDDLQARLDEYNRLSASTTDMDSARNTRLGTDVIGAFTKFGQNYALAPVGKKADDTSDRISAMGAEGYKEASDARLLKLKSLKDTISALQDQQKELQSEKKEADKLKALDERSRLARESQEKIAGMRVSGDEERRDIGRKSLALREKLANRLSDKQTSELIALDNAETSISSIKAIKPKIDTGPVSDIRNRISATVGADDPKVSAFRAEVQDNLAEQIKILSGTAASDKERQFLAKNTPALSDNDATFMAKLHRIEEKLKQRKSNALKNIKSQGKDISSFQSNSIDVEENKPKTIIQNGYTYTLNDKGEYE